jgi:hypothetical protein
LVLSRRHSITRGCAIPCENVHNTMVSVWEETEGDFVRITARSTTFCRFWITWPLVLS